MKIRLMEAEVFHATSQKDGRTDNTKLIVVFHNSSKAHKTE